MRDVVLINGVVFDGIRFLPVGTRVRIHGSHIADVGDDIDTSDADLVDLDGGTLLPGFVDAHAHPAFAGVQLRSCDLSATTTARQCVEFVADFARAHPDREWITGGGWPMAAFPAGTPTRQLLDAVVPDRPVYLPNRDGHSVWVNTETLRLAGIDADTPDPPDGRIEREPDGTPAGTLHDGAADLASRLLPEVSGDERYQGLLVAQDYLLSLGITGWQDAMVGDYLDGADPFGAYVRAAGNGALKVTVEAALWWDLDRGPEQLPELVERRRIGQLERFRANTVKLMLDGVVESHTAALLEPYLDHDGCASDNRGLDLIEPAAVARYVTDLDALGFAVHFHALGDRAVRSALDAVATARRTHHSTLRHHLAHLQVVHPDDIGRFAALAASANIQALWAAHEPQMDELTIPFLGPTRTGRQYPFESLRRAGARLVAGSDWPVSTPDPLAAAHVAVNRTELPADGAHAREPFLPDQALPLATFLAAYTSGSAWINGRELAAGRVAAGFDADLAIVDADLAHVGARDIGRAVVRQTWVRGGLVYERR